VARDADIGIRCSAPRRSFYLPVGIVDAIQFLWWDGFDCQLSSHTLLWNLGGTLTRLNKLDQFPVVLFKMERLSVLQKV
jgi:hypothetical protein